MDFPPIGAIALIAFFVGQIVKATPLDKKWIPIICGFVGGILGLVGRTVLPELVDTDWLSALAIGIFSGLSATGVHQIYKQMFAGNSEIQNGEEK